MFGPLNAAELPKFASDASAFLHEHGCTRILNDLREVDLELSTVDIYDIPNLVAGSGIERSVKRAVVFSRDVGDYQFFETVSVNQGQFVRVFEDFDVAVTWLRGNEVS